VGFACSNRCVFCAQGDLRLSEQAVSSKQISNQLQRLATEGVRSVAFVGGEPTLHEELPGWIREAQGSGFASVLLQTNGRRLAYPAYTNALRRAALRTVEVSMAGPREQVHEYHTRVPQSFRQSVAGVAGARRAGLTVGLTFVVTRSNFRHLAEMVEQAARLDVQAVHLSSARPRGAALADLGRIVPRFEAMASYFERAADTADTLGVPLVVSGTPLCQLPGLECRALSVLRGTEPAADARFGTPCSECALRAFCPGLEPAYADRYGFTELRAQPGLDAKEQDRATAAAVAHAHLFAGLGATNLVGGS
jgi:pyruvate-formate lyase-activating enzyme